MTFNRNRLPLNRSTLALCVALGLATSGCTENASTDQGNTAMAAPANQADARSSVKAQVSADTDRQIAGQRKELLADAEDALDQTGKAIEALEKEDKKGSP